MDTACAGSHSAGGMVDDAAHIACSGEGMVETTVDLGNQTHMSRPFLLLDDPSPLPTELEVSEVELVMDSPVHEKGCYCHMLEWPDRQPESYEDWDVCDYCKAANGHHQYHPVDDMETDVDHFGSGEPVLDECDSPQGAGEGLEFVDLDAQSPPRKFRRLRPMVLDPMDPLMMNSPRPVETASVDAEKNVSPHDLLLQPDHHDQEESLVCPVSWLM